MNDDYIPQTATNCGFSAALNTEGGVAQVRNTKSIPSPSRLALDAQFSPRIPHSVTICGIKNRLGRSE